MATYLTRTMGTPTSTRIWTYAGWHKRSELTSNQNSFLSWGTSTYTTDLHYEGNSDSLYLYFDDSSGYYAKTKAVYRDASAWYHVVIAVDTTQATESNRLKLYVNGTQYGPALDGTDWTQHEIFPQNYDFPQLASGQTMAIGVRNAGTTHFYQGYMSEVFFLDGQQLTPSSFGSTNANGIWVPNTSPSVTYGNNGFRLQFAGTGTSADSSGFGADTSGNNNHFATTSLGTNPNTTDTPQNNFSIMNPLNIYPNSTPIITDGGLKTQSQSTSAAGLCSTMAVSAGKWYAEGKIGSGATLEVGAVDIGSHAFNKTGTTTNSVAYDYGGNIRVNNSNTQTGLSTYTGGDIIGILLNMDTATGTVTFYKNGSAVGSAQNFTTSKPQFAAFYMQSHTSGGNQSVQWNLGNPTFAIASSNADANGEGSFEYAVPSGYYALCTNNLALYGG